VCAREWKWKVSEILSATFIFAALSHFLFIWKECSVDLINTVEDLRLSLNWISKGFVEYPTDFVSPLDKLQKSFARELPLF
jgi:hypothetical protein